MKVYGFQVTDEQIAAGLAAMKGDFTCKDVERALAAAGGEYLGRTADRLLQKERKAGRIIALNNKQWRAVEQAA